VMYPGITPNELAVAVPAYIAGIREKIDEIDHEGEPQPPHPNSTHAYGMDLGPTALGSSAAGLEHTFGNHDGQLDKLEASLIWAAGKLNGHAGTHLRGFFVGSFYDQRGDIGPATNIRIDEHQFRDGYLKPLTQQLGEPLSFEAHLGIMTEIMAPVVIAKLHNGLEPTKEQVLTMVAGVLAHNHVPIADFAAVVRQRAGGSEADASFLEQRYQEALGTPPAPAG